MKNFRFLSILLCLSLVFGCLTFPVRATESQPETQTETSADTEPTIPDVKDMPFGTVSIYNGCRTIEGMVPLAVPTGNWKQPSRPFSMKSIRALWSTPTTRI